MCDPQTRRSHIPDRLTQPSFWRSHCSGASSLLPRLLEPSPTQGFSFKLAGAAEFDEHCYVVLLERRVLGHTEGRAKATDTWSDNGEEDVPEAVKDGELMRQAQVGTGRHRQLA